MVKLAENKVVDIDVMPGTDEDKLKAQADAIRYALAFWPGCCNLLLCFLRFLNRDI